MRRKSVSCLSAEPFFSALPLCALEHFASRFFFGVQSLSVHPLLIDKLWGKAEATLRKRKPKQPASFFSFITVAFFLFFF